MQLCPVFADIININNGFCALLYITAEMAATFDFTSFHPGFLKVAPFSYTSAVFVWILLLFGFKIQYIPQSNF